MASAGAVDVDTLDLGHLASFVGMRVDALVLEQLAAAGFADARHAYGFVFQHLLGAPRTITELAKLLGVTQQAASKLVAELAARGYVEDADSEDGRARRLALSARGRACIRKARSIRAAIARKIVERHGEETVRRGARLLASVLEELGGLDAVRARRVRAPR